MTDSNFPAAEECVATIIYSNSLFLNSSRFATPCNGTRCQSGCGWQVHRTVNSECLPAAVTGARRCWLGLLHRRFPSLEFVRNVTVRTATDTMRNQGIITLLLTVKGSFEPKLIKERLQVTFPAQDTYSTVDKSREVVELHKQKRRMLTFGSILASVCDTGFVRKRRSAHVH